MATLNRPQIEAVAGMATYPIVGLLSVVHALRANLSALADRCGQPMGELPCPRATMNEFKQLIGWHELEKQQERLELGDASRCAH